MQKQMMLTTVSDTGIGIKQDDMTKLFQFFGKVSETKHIN